MGNAKRMLGAVAFVVIVGSCANTGDGEDAPAVAVSSPGSAAAGPMASPVAEFVAPAVEAQCHSDDAVYDGEDTCHPGGELVAVVEVLDGNTLELEDGRVVRLLGVQVPDAGACAGPGATEFTRALVEGNSVKLHAEPSIEVDAEGRLLRYVQYSESLSRDGLPTYARDLGTQVVLEGWGLPNDGQANATYLESLAGAAGIAEYRPEGIYAPPCGSPLVYGDDDGNGVADWDEDEDVDLPDVDLPDGALTGGYCARKWWC